MMIPLIEVWQYALFITAGVLLFLGGIVPVVQRIRGVVSYDAMWLWVPALILIIIAGVMIGSKSIDRGRQETILNFEETRGGSVARVYISPYECDIFLWEDGNGNTTVSFEYTVKGEKYWLDFVEPYSD